MASVPPMVLLLPLVRLCLYTKTLMTLLLWTLPLALVRPRNLISLSVVLDDSKNMPKLHLSVALTSIPPYQLQFLPLLSLPIFWQIYLFHPNLILLKLVTLPNMYPWSILTLRMSSLYPLVHPLYHPINLKLISGSTLNQASFLLGDQCIQCPLLSVPQWLSTSRTSSLKDKSDCQSLQLVPLSYLLNGKLANCASVLIIEVLTQSPNEIPTSYLFAMISLMSLPAVNSLQSSTYKMPST